MGHYTDGRHWNDKTQAWEFDGSTESSGSSNDMEWINVKDRFPEPDVVVLVMDRFFVRSDLHQNSKDFLPHREAGIRLGYLFKSGTFRSEGVNGNCDITHWMPLPSPPEGE